MKKKLIGVAIVAAITVAAGWNFNQSKNEMKMSDLTLANVEALAFDEGQSDSTCYSTYHGCWFWNCYNIFWCNSGCEAVRSDDHKDSSFC